MKGGGQGPEIIKDLLYLATDILREHQDLHQLALDLHTLFMQDPLCRDLAHLLPEHIEIDPIVERQEQLGQSLEEIVLPTLGDITQDCSLTPQTHYDYAPGLKNIVLHKGTNEDFLTENQVLTFRQKLDQSDQRPNPDLLSQNPNLLKLLTSPWK